MSSFPRPLLAAALASSSSSSAASSSLSFLRQSSSTSLSQVRYFSSTPSCRKTARDVEREIQAEQTKAREMLETQQHQNTQMRNAYATPEGRKRVNEVAVPQASEFLLFLTSQPVSLEAPACWHVKPEGNLGALREGQLPAAPRALRP